MVDSVDSTMADSAPTQITGCNDRGGDSGGSFPQPQPVDLDDLDLGDLDDLGGAPTAAAADPTQSIRSGRPFPNFASPAAATMLCKRYPAVRGNVMCIPLVTCDQQQFPSIHHKPHPPIIAAHKKLPMHSTLMRIFRDAAGEPFQKPHLAKLSSRGFHNFAGHLLVYIMPYRLQDNYHSNVVDSFGDILRSLGNTIIPAFIADDCVRSSEFANYPDGDSKRKMFMRSELEMEFYTDQEQVYEFKVIASIRAAVRVLGRRCTNLAPPRLMLSGDVPLNGYPHIADYPNCFHLYGITDSRYADYCDHCDEASLIASAPSSAASSASASSVASAPSSAAASAAPASSAQSAPPIAKRSRVTKNVDRVSW